VRQDTAWHALTDPSMRNSSYICIAISLFNNLTGQSLICMYSTAIFEGLASKGSLSHYVVKQENNFIGWAAVVGAVCSYYTVSWMTRRALFVGGHFIMAVLMLMCGLYCDQKKHDLVLLCICLFVFVFQCTQGSAIFIYIAEVVSSDSVMGLCLFTLMFGLTTQSMSATYVFNSKLGINGMFYLLGAI